MNPHPKMERGHGHRASFSITDKFSEIWCVDFEFNGARGELPHSVCMVAHELNSKRRIRLWQDELLGLKGPPFDIGQNTLVVAYQASAELGCFLALGWALPINILDLYVEHRVQTNGLSVGDSLIRALAWRGLAHIDAFEKDALRKLVTERTHWTPEEQEAILDYCSSDVLALEALLPVMQAEIDTPRALLRGRYMKAVAMMQCEGMPVDYECLLRLRKHWDAVKLQLISEVDHEYGVYEKQTFKRTRFENYLRRKGIDWPRFPDGKLMLDAATFKEQEQKSPELRLLRELRSTLSQMNLWDLAVGHDGMARAQLKPFMAKTGRNQPSTSEFVFGTAKWIRKLIKPPKGFGLAYIDFRAQENGIAAGLSNDPRMINGYEGGDPYIAFAKEAGLAPPTATKETHALVRSRCKELVLGLNYGMGKTLFAKRADLRLVEADELLRLHREKYPRYHTWLTEQADRAQLEGFIETVFGWRLHISKNTRGTTLLNFPMQANGAEMMRIAAIVATEMGITLCAPIHDAFVISAPLDLLDEQVELMRSVMSEAGRIVCGISIGTEAQVVRWPDRFTDERGEAMWEKVMRVLNQVEHEAV